MFTEFINDEAGYLAWVQNNPEGFVLNIDHEGYFPQYPMVHKATHKLISSPARTNYTTGKYYKVCSSDLKVLEEWSQTHRQKKVTLCATCM